MAGNSLVSHPLISHAIDSNDIFLSLFVDNAAGNEIKINLCDLTVLHHYNISFIFLFLFAKAKITFPKPMKHVDSAQYYTRKLTSKMTIFWNRKLTTLQTSENLQWFIFYFIFFLA